MFESPGRKYFEALRQETGFTRDPLEKMYRLVDLLKSIAKIEVLNGKLALKGGTAIQLMFFDLSRLSVDVDLNYIGSPDMEIMQADRDLIRKMFEKLFREKDYVLDKTVKMYALEQFELKYTGVAGNRDRLKIEVNYLERLPVISVENKLLSHPFYPLGEVTFLTYSFEEHMAQKTRALLTRTTPRDLFDIYQMILTGKRFDRNLYRKLALFYLILAPVDVRSVDPVPISKIDERDVSSNLAPLLTKDLRNIDLEEMKKAVLPLMEDVLDLDEIEEEALDIFYDEHRFVQDLFFHNIPIGTSLDEHPSLIWRLKRLENPEGLDER